MSDTITCEWCAEEIPAGSSRCPKCQGSVNRVGQRIQGAPLAAKAEPPQPSKPNPPAGWYDDAKMVNTRRYWDGEHWTEHRQEKPPAMPAIFTSPRELLTAKTRSETRTLFNWGLAMAILFPLIGFIIGIVLLGKRSTWGIRVMGLSVVMGIIYIKLAT